MIKITLTVRNELWLKSKTAVLHAQYSRYVAKKDKLAALDATTDGG